MGDKKINQNCQSCGGDGVQIKNLPEGGTEEVSCDACDGTGLLSWGELKE